ncbi:hypothetical protein MMC11_002166 [Xylographa trunciseda]|nr:hypothetical protein [Xylographa trunciseda]
MASHTLAIAKASLAAGLMRPDPTSVQRDQITHFHKLLDEALTHCSPTNIQRCKEWLLRNAISSIARVTSIGKYLAALSASLSESLAQSTNASNRARTPGSRRKQLHVLYLVNDLLHHTKYHKGSPSASSVVTSTFQPFLSKLVEAASAYDSNVYPKQRQRISTLLDEWEKQDYYSSLEIGKLRDISSSAGCVTTENGQAEPSAVNIPINGEDKNKAEAPFMMPASHGDLSAPYYELPAGNMMPHIIPNSATPINPHIVKPLQFLAGPADERLAFAVKDFLKDVDKLYGQQSMEEEGISIDIDELGQTVPRDEIGETVASEAYYGWTKAFCEKMKLRRSGKIIPRSRGRSDSLGGSQSPRKRRRYSSSGNSRSRSRPNQRRQESYSPSRNRLRSRTRSQSPPPRFGRRPASRSRSRSYSPPGDLPPPKDYPTAQPTRPVGQFQAQSHVASSTPPLPFPVPFPQGIPLGPNGMPIPPPPPPNYVGVWPPPPPSISPNSGPFQVPPFVPPPPPPPLIPPYGNSHSMAMGYQVQGAAAGQGWAAQEPHEQYGNGGYGRLPPQAQGQGGGSYSGRGGRGGRGAWRG